LQKGMEKNKNVVFGYGERFEQSHQLAAVKWNRAKPHFTYNRLPESLFFSCYLYVRRFSIQLNRSWDTYFSRHFFLYSPFLFLHLIKPTIPNLLLIKNLIKNHAPFFLNFVHIRWTEKYFWIHKYFPKYLIWNRFLTHCRMCISKNVFGSKITSCTYSAFLHLISVLKVKNVYIIIYKIKHTFRSFLTSPYHNL